MSSNDSQQQKQTQNEKEIRATFTFESGPMLNFKNALYSLWKQCYIYDGSPMNNVTLKIGARKNKSLTQLMIKKKPSKAILANLHLRNIQ